MEPGDTAGTLTATDSWRSALRNWRDNPLYLRLSLARRRQEGSGNKLARYAALFIGLVPAVFTAGTILLTTSYVTAVDIESALNGAIVAFIITASVVWFAQGFHQAVLDCMLLLNRSQRKQQSVTIDDLAAVSGMSNHEIAVGALAAILPNLWLRIFAAVCGGLAVYLLFLSEFLDRINSDVLLAVFLALPAASALAIGGILASIALGLYLICMSENYSFSLASATAVLYSLGALFWIAPSVGLALMIQSLMSPGYYAQGREEEIWLAASLLAPLAFILLVWLALIMVRDVRWLRPVYALGSPWLNPVLLIIVVMTLLAFSGDWEATEVIGITMMCLLYQFGSFAPLSLTHLPTVAMLSADAGGMQVPAQLLSYGLQLALQLGLIFICGRHALTAIENRRQSPLS